MTDDNIKSILATLLTSALFAMFCIHAVAELAR